MPRDIPIGNGNLLINFDQDYCLRDLYFPRVGNENHTSGHKFKFGIWVDGQFDWIDEGWDLRLEYDHKSLSTHVTALKKTWGIRCEFHDLVSIVGFNVNPLLQILSLISSNSCRLLHTQRSSFLRDRGGRPPTGPRPYFQARGRASRYGKEPC
jgi:hypothetical protein